MVIYMQLNSKQICLNDTYTGKFFKLTALHILSSYTWHQVHEV